MRWITGPIESVDAYFGSPWPRRALLGACVVSLVCAVSVDTVVARSLSPAMRVGPGPDLAFDDAFWQRHTDLGKAERWLIPAAVVVFFAWAVSWRGLWVRGWYFVFAVALGGLVVHPAKALVGRTRPKLLIEDGVYTARPFGWGMLSDSYDYSSWPSGHSCVAGAVFMALVVMAPRWWPLWLVPTAGIAASRVVVHAHYPGDVLAGFTLGAVVALAVARHPAFKPVSRVPLPD